MRTKTDLITSVMQQDSAISAGETVTADDSDLISVAYDTKLAEWRRRGFVWWTNTNATTAEIPDEVFSTLSLLVWNEVKSSFGYQASLAEQLQAEDQLLKRLRRLNMKPPSGEATRFSSY